MGCETFQVGSWLLRTLLEAFLSTLDLCFCFLSFGLPGVSGPPRSCLGGGTLSSPETGIEWFSECFSKDGCSSRVAAPFCVAEDEDKDGRRSRLARFLLLLCSSASLFRLLALSS